jgi:hypothetical protein
MRVQRLVLFVSTLTMGGMAVQPAVSQENRGTEEQRMACTPDVWRLCGAEIPDVERIKACLRANVPQLSPPCRAVFETASTDESRRRARRPAAPQQPYQTYPRYPAYQDDDE